MPETVIVVPEGRYVGGEGDATVFSPGVPEASAQASPQATSPASAQASEDAWFRSGGAETPAAASVPPPVAGDPHSAKTEMIVHDGAPTVISPASVLAPAGASVSSSTPAFTPAPAPTFAPTSVPTSLGPYQLGDRLGSDGIGDIFRARHQALGKEVTLKLLNADTGSMPSLVKRLFAEAQLVNEIDDENIVEINDFASEPGGPSYYVMEQLRGPNLAQARAQGGPFTVAQTLSVGLQICSALKAAHAHGVVHRDLRPENVFLTERAGRNDFVKLTNFGLAKVFDTFRSGSFTVAQPISSAPQYLSPEQAGGRAIDARSDVYALGVLLYWMLSDRLPFRDTEFDKLIVLRLTTAPADLPETLPSGEALTVELSRIVLRCLACKPIDRYQSVAEVAAVLAQAQTRLPLPTPAKAAPRPVSYRSRILAGLAVAAFLAVGGAWVVAHGWALPAMVVPGTPIDPENLVVVPQLPPALSPLPLPSVPKVTAKLAPAPKRPAPSVAHLAKRSAAPHARSHAAAAKARPAAAEAQAGAPTPDEVAPPPPSAPATAPAPEASSHRSIIESFHHPLGE